MEECTRYGKFKVPKPSKRKPLHLMSRDELLTNVQYKKLKEQIESFKLLSPDENQDEYGYFKDKIILIAKQVAESSFAVLGCTNGNAFPLTNGSIRLTLHFNAYQVIYEIVSEESILVRHYLGEEPIRLKFIEVGSNLENIKTNMAN